MPEQFPINSLSVGPFLLFPFPVIAYRGNCVFGEGVLFLPYMPLNLRRAEALQDTPGASWPVLSNKHKHKHIWIVLVTVLRDFRTAGQDLYRHSPIGAGLQASPQGKECTVPERLPGPHKPSSHVLSFRILSASCEISTSVSPITIPSPKSGSIYFASFCCPSTTVLCPGAPPVTSIYFITFSLVIDLSMWNLWRAEVGCWESQWLKKSHPHFPPAVLGYFYQLSTTRTSEAQGIPTAQLAPRFMSPASAVLHLLFPHTKPGRKHTAYYVQV